jgi:hypothetical protein
VGLVVGLWIEGAVGAVVAYRTWPGSKNWYFGKHLGGAVMLFTIIGALCGKLASVVL